MMTVDRKTSSTGAALLTLLIGTPFLMGSKGGALPVPDTLNTAAFQPADFKFTDSLRVNEKDLALYAVNAGEREGLEQIARLSRTATSDEGWLFLPNRSLWLEIPTDKNSQDEVFASALKYSMQLQEGRVLFCHMHGITPAFQEVKSKVRVQIPLDYDRASPEQMKPVLDRLDHILYPVTAIPTAQEISTALLNVVLSLELVHDFKVISRYGVTNFELDREKIRAELSGADQGSIEEISKTLHDALGRSYNLWSNQLIAKILDNPNYRFDPASISEIFEPFADIPYIRFSFEPRR